MLRTAFVCFAAVVWPLAAQSDNAFHKPPAGVEAALRENIRQFYQAHVDGKFRQAEQFVAEDTKDFFYTANKPKYVSFEVTRIDYNEDFTRAKAVVLCEQYIMMPGFTDKPMKVPTPSTWKLENGKWVWYVDQSEMRKTPFGNMTPGTAPAAGPVRTTPPAAADVAALLSAVKADKAAATLQSGAESSDQVLISNGLPGAVKLSISGAVPGVEAALDRTDLKAGEKAVLSLHAKGPGAKSGILHVSVSPTNQLLPIRVIVK